jgi:diadenosine tetraphosphate (Ap4A) HIT family hydrolase
MTTMKYPTVIHKRVELARAGKNPTLICRMRSGWCVLGDSQFLRGYCLLLADPIVPSLNDMSHDARAVFLEDMVIIGDAVLKCTEAYRINYEILGNADPALHAHMFPRYISEPEERRLAPIWQYDKALRASVKFDVERDGKLMEALRREIAAISAPPTGPHPFTHPTPPKTAQNG